MLLSTTKHDSPFNRRQNWFVATPFVKHLHFDLYVNFHEVGRGAHAYKINLLWCALFGNGVRCCKPVFSTGKLHFVLSRLHGCNRFRQVESALEDGDGELLAVSINHYCEAYMLQYTDPEIPES